MRLRATQQINSGLGTYPAGRIFELDDDAVAEAWIEARIAEPAPRGVDADDAGPSPAEKPLHRMNKAELTEILEGMGLDTSGSNKVMAERIREARDAQ